MINPPTNLDAVTVSSTRIDLTWTNVQVYDEIRVRRNLHVETGPVKDFYIDGEQEAFSDATCEHGTRYYYEVYGRVGSEWSAPSNQDYDITVLPAPSNLSANPITSKQVDLTWVNNSTYYTTVRIERKISGGSYSEIASIGGTETTFQDTTVTSGQVYFYRVYGYRWVS